MRAAQQKYTTEVVTLSKFVESTSREVLRLHSRAEEEGWDADAPRAIWSRLWESPERLVVVLRHEEHGSKGEVLAHATDFNATCRPYDRRSSFGVAHGVRTCRLLLMSLANMSSRNPRSSMLESSQVAFDALTGTFRVIQVADAQLSVNIDEKNAWLPNICELTPESGYAPELKVTAQVESMRTAAIARGAPFDDVKLTTIQEHLTDLQRLMLEREIVVVTMRPGTTSTDVQQVLIEFGLVKVPAPLPMEEPRRRARKQRAGE